MTQQLAQGFWIFGGILAVVALLAAKAVWDEKKRDAKFMRQIRESFGQIPKRAYGPGDLASIGAYYRLYGEKAACVIDDTTWNDLDMDRIFAVLNQTWSSSGEEYLYYMLRTPCLEEETLLERERLISYFVSHPEERTRLSLAFRHIGKTRGLSAAEYMHRLLELPERGNGVQIAQAVLGAASMASLAIVPTYGILFFIGMMIVNIGTYYRQMGEDRPYISCFGYVMRLLEQAEQLERTKIPELEPYYARMRAARKAFEKFRRNSFLLKEGNSLTGNLLESILDYFRMFLHLDIIKFNSMLAEFRTHLPEIETLMAEAGHLEACIAVASFRELMPYTVQPVFCREKKYAVKELYHPLIEYPVANDICAEGGVLITGSNASGKSTFLKTAAISAILAQTVHTALASSYEGSFFRIYSSMAIADDLEGQESYYIAEIRSLKRILDAGRFGEPVLCFVDEVLRGTNTVERIAASSEILKSLSEGKVICFAATHDIELTYILEQVYENYHFSEEIDEEKISFPYKLFGGRATTRNAIRLLGLMGYDQKIVRRAERSAEAFLRGGVWENFGQE